MRYLHPRPSAAGNGYDPTASGGSNCGPLDPKLAEQVAGDAKTLAAASPGATLPLDAVTASGSGLDPDISPENAALQVAGNAPARHADPEAVRAFIAPRVQGRSLGVLGEPRVNVLLTNTSSTWKAWWTWSGASPACASARRCRTAFSPTPTRSRWWTSHPRSCACGWTRARSMCPRPPGSPPIASSGWRI